MVSIHVAVTAEHIAAAGDWRMKWAEPLEAAIAELTGQYVDIDGGDADGQCIATIGQGEWTVVVDLPKEANDWLARRWGDAPSGFASPETLEDRGEPFEFDLPIADWVVDLIRDPRPWLTLREAAARLGVKPSTLRQQAQDEWNGSPGPSARARRLGVVKLGRDWFVDRVAVEREVARADGARLDDAIATFEI